ncbi:Anthranilate phosphoribosyltransferase [bioreactor metagenome]|uniref:Anthranilate phosphoribosyltransferase n=1 Tax=bioreactor metagenome TaxID=1076179 RepID=A0A645I7H1_9ZZZZ
MSSAEESRETMIGALENKPGAAREIVCLNAGAALYVANVADSIGDGIAKAREAITSGAARARLDQFVQCTQRLGGRA